MPWRDCCRAMKRTSPCWRAPATCPRAPAKPTAASCTRASMPQPGTLKAKLNVEGAQDVPGAVRRGGRALWSARRDGAGLYARRSAPTSKRCTSRAWPTAWRACVLIEREEILSLEPNVNPGVVCALLAPTSGITSPYELTCALADHAAVNGVDFLRGYLCGVGAAPAEAGYLLETDPWPHGAPGLLINCAGVDSARLHNHALPTPKAAYHHHRRKGEYYLLDHTTPLAVLHDPVPVHPPRWARACWSAPRCMAIPPAGPQRPSDIPGRYRRVHHRGGA